MRTTRELAAFVVLGVSLASCRGAPSRGELENLRAKAEKAALEAPHPREILAQPGDHRGPPVARGSAGTARFASTLRGAFEKERAMQIALFADGFYREPGNDGFEAVLDRVKEELADAGFGKKDGFELATIETPMSSPAWTPISARLALKTRTGEEELLEFHDPAGAARTMLPRNAPSADLEGEIALALDDVRAGTVLVLEKGASKGTLDSARERGAVAVLAAGLADYNVDPSGAERHRDAIPYSSAPYPCPLPVARVSDRVLQRIRDARAADPAARLAFRASTRFDERPLRTLVATVKGDAHASEAVVVAAHVQEPGACDNASGLAGTCAAARAIATAIDKGELRRPARTLVFLWGLENRESRIFLEKTELQVVAGISADMLGESRASTGALALLERLPDPGAVRVLQPDEHTAWGSSPVEASALVPSGLAVIARCAMLDVAELDAARGDLWKTAEHPYEGGSDHSEFLAKGIPAVLFWHFPDFAYHTSLDRMEHVDATELARTSVAVATCALGVADASPADLDRYLASLKLELDVRLDAATHAADDEIARTWREWATGARQWLRRLCLANVATSHDASKPGATQEPANANPPHQD